MSGRRRPTVGIVGLSIAVAAPLGVAAQTAGTGAQAASTSGRVSAPPANSAMRRAGGGAVPAQNAMASGQGGGISNATNATTLTRGDQGQSMQGSQSTADQQRSTGRNGAQQAPSIDSNGMIQRDSGSPPR